MSASPEMASVLLLGALFVFALELFLPSAGILFAVGVLCVLGSLATAFVYDPLWGAGFLMLDVALLLVLPGIALQVWQRTPLGRRMFLDSDGPGEDADVVPEPDPLTLLVGKVGTTRTPLRPAGTVDIDGRRVDTVSEGVMIGAGEPVKVVRVDGNRVVVRLHAAAVTTIDKVTTLDFDSPDFDIGPTT